MTFRPLPGLSVAAFLALAVLIGLGTWQLQRRAEKHEILDRIATRASSAPAPVEILLATGDFAAFRHATALGTLDRTKEIYVWHPRTDGGPTRQGKKVITPLALDSGGTILVDRGWVPQAWRNADKDVEDLKGEIEVEGVLRPPATPGTFTPPEDAANHLFFARNSAAIAKSLGLTLKTPLILEATKRLGEPEPLEADLNIPDNHLNYAITWYSLAVVLAVIYLRYHYVRGRLKFGR